MVVDTTAPHRSMLGTSVENVASRDAVESVLVTAESGDLEFCVETLTHGLARSMPLAIEIDGSALSVVVWVTDVSPSNDSYGGRCLTAVITDVASHDSGLWMPQLNIRCEIYFHLDPITQRIAAEGVLSYGSR
ncbi:MAG: hypothetical protein JWR11_2616 [Mycobacterium sp.]|nr:hypothetical protein [Mycobacterium sp.]